MILAIFLIVGGCATPYQAEQRNGGYSDSKIGKNRWEVSFRANAYTKPHVAAMYAKQRAREICVHNGFDGFELEGSLVNDGPSRGVTPVVCNQIGASTICSGGKKRRTWKTAVLRFSCYRESDS